MKLSFDQLQERARAAAIEAQGLPREDAELVILKVLVAVYSAGQHDMLEAVEVKFLHQEHH